MMTTTADTVASDCDAFRTIYDTRELISIVVNSRHAALVEFRTPVGAEWKRGRQRVGARDAFPELVYDKFPNHSRNVLEFSAVLNYS